MTLASLDFARTSTVRGASVSRRPVPLVWSAALPACLALACAVLAVALNWRGADLPAQLFRVELFRRTGFAPFNLQWYDGHYTLSYSLLFPALGATFGPWFVATASAVVAACCFERIVHAEFGPHCLLGACWFAVATVTNLAIGRLTFALGVAVGLGAVLALQRGRLVLGLALTLFCPLASPVTGVFLALGAAAWLLTAATRRGRALAIGTGLLAGGPVLILAALYPEGGTFPFQLVELVIELASCALLYGVMRHRHRVVAVGALLYAMAATALFVIPTPMGGNVGRLGMYFAGPLLACALWPTRRALLALVAPVLLIWVWFPAGDAILFAGQDESTHPEYYTALVRHLEQLPGPPPRVEIPFTQNHWETAYVAPNVPLARGWERQLDVATNPIFYGDRLDAVTYWRWLRDNAVAYVALPDAPIDFSALREVRVINGRPAYLHEVWHDRHWQLFAVQDARPLVDGRAQLVSTSDDALIVRVRAAGRVVVRVHFTPNWTIDGDACIAATRAGWTEIRARHAGTVALTAALIGDAACDS